MYPVVLFLLFVRVFCYVGQTPVKYKYITAWHSPLGQFVTLEFWNLRSEQWCVVQSCSGPQECHAFVLWFDTDFSLRFCKEHPVKLSTSPYTPQTHWCQTVLVLRYVLYQAGSMKLYMHAYNCCQHHHTLHVHTPGQVDQ